jgi:predicted transcriptional regulator
MNNLMLLQYLDWREERRLLAWQLKQHGWKQKRIAEVLEVSPGAVSRWVNRAAQNGADALRIHKRGVRQVHWTEERLNRIPGLMARVEQYPL